MPDRLLGIPALFKKIVAIVIPKGQTKFYSNKLISLEKLTDPLSSELKPIQSSRSNSGNIFPAVALLPKTANAHSMRLGGFCPIIPQFPPLPPHVGKALFPSKNSVLIFGTSVAQGK
jgi:hypothetical protein